MESWGSGAKLQSALLLASGCWQSLVAVDLVVWRSQGLHHTAVRSVDGLPNLFLFIFNMIEFVAFYPLKGKALDNVSHGTTCQLFYSLKMNTDHIPVSNCILFSRHTKASHCFWGECCSGGWIPPPDRANFHITLLLHTLPCLWTQWEGWQSLGCL